MTDNADQDMKEKAFVLERHEAVQKCTVEHPDKGEEQCMNEYLGQRKQKEVEDRERMYERALEDDLTSIKELEQSYNLYCKENGIFRPEDRESALRILGHFVMSGEDDCRTLEKFLPPHRLQTPSSKPTPKR